MTIYEKHNTPTAFFNGNVYPFIYFDNIHTDLFTHHDNDINNANVVYLYF